MIRRASYGALVFTGPDGAGLPRLPDALPRAKESAYLLMFAGDEHELQQALENTLATLHAEGWKVNKTTTIARQQRPFERYPTFRVLVFAEQFIEDTA